MHRATLPKSAILLVWWTIGRNIDHMTGIYRSFMMNFLPARMKHDELINEVTRVIAETVDPQTIILFGSYAEGNPHRESDIDLFVIKEVDISQVRSTKQKIRKALRSIMISNHLEIDLIVDSHRRITDRIMNGDIFFKDILDKGNSL